jgi:hypothetical protein
MSFTNHGGGFRAAKTPSPSAASDDGNEGRGFHCFRCARTDAGATCRSATSSTAQLFVNCIIPQICGREKGWIMIRRQGSGLFSAR